MISIDMYILHVSSLVVCFSNISAYFALREVMKVCLRWSPHVKVKVVAGCFCFTRFPPRSRVGIGRDSFSGFSGVMISIKSIDMHIRHESSVGVCFAKTLQIYHAIAIFPYFPPVPREVAGWSRFVFSSGLCRYA